MNLQQTYCNDLYNLIDGDNTGLYNEHKRWYNEFKARSVGDLLDKQQAMINSYKRALDNSTQEIADLKNKLEVANKSL